MKIRNFGTVVGCLLFAGSAFATTISGSANISGSVTVTKDAIMFQPTIVPTPFATETGSFAGFSTGTIKTLTGGPVTGPVNITDFALFNVTGVSPVHFDLTNISPGGGTVANCASPGGGVVCTPAGSPFELVQGPSGVGATIRLQGIGYTGTSATGFTPTTGIFTAQFNFVGVNLNALLTQIAAGDYTNTTNVSYSATFTANPVPEPSPASLLFAGVALIAGSRAVRRYRQNN